MMSLQMLSTIIFILDLFATLLNLCSGFDYDCATVPACFFLLQPCIAYCLTFKGLMNVIISNLIQRTYKWQAIMYVAVKLSEVNSWLLFNIQKQ